MTNHSILTQNPFETPVFLISIIATLAAYCAFPLLYSNFRKYPITATKFRITCFLFNLIPMFVFFILFSSTSAFPYILWTTVFSASGIKNLRSSGILIEPDEKEPVEDQTLSSNVIIQTDTSTDERNQHAKESITAGSTFSQTKEKPSKQRYCKFCGKPIEPDTKKCTGCGKQYFRSPVRRDNVTWLLLTVCAFSIAAYFAYRSDQYNEKISQCEQQIEQYKYEVSVLNKKIDELEAEIDEKDLLVFHYKQQTYSLLNGYLRRNK